MNKIIALCLVACSAGLLMAQEKLAEQTLFTVADDTVTAEEYMAVYNKNRNLGEDIDPKTPREYLDMYINFKLKVHQAKELGMDTMQSFVREYMGYRDQLAKPYLSDKDVTQELIDEAAERMQYDVRASHIMVGIPRGATPEDTLKAYNKALEIKAKISKGASFEEMAKQFSDDSYSAKQGGDLGYFTVFNMVYPFENAVYEADLGELVGPVKTRFGYHIVKKTDQREARGQITVNHILIVANKKSTEEQEAAAEKKINELYDELEAGADFGTLARQYSEDKTSAKKGGRLLTFGINKMYIDFEDAAYALKEPGDYSKPVKTDIGWHIIQLVNHHGVVDNDDLRADLKARLDKDMRAQQSRMSVLKKLKNEYSYSENEKNKSRAFAQVNDALLKGEYNPKEVKGADKVVFTFANKKYTTADVLQYIASQKPMVKEASRDMVLDMLYKDYVDQQLIAYEKTQLAKKYPEFRLLSREYFEGILLFDLTEDKVWRKSVTDTVGLKEYYSQHKERYQWDDRYRAYIVDASTPKVAKKAAKMLKKGGTVEAVQAELNEASQLNVKIDSNVYEAGTNAMIDAAEKKTGYSKPAEKDGRYFVIGIEEIIPAGTKTYEEARGMVISDYQKYLEEEWIKSLKETYQVTIDKEVLDKVVKQLESES